MPKKRATTAKRTTTWTLKKEVAYVPSKVGKRRHRQVWQLYRNGQFERWFNTKKEAAAYLAKHR